MKPDWTLITYITGMVAIAFMIACQPGTPSNAEAIELEKQARQSRHNARMQPKVNRFAEVWYKGHQYLLYVAHREIAITHAGHCTGEHAEAVGYPKGHTQ